MPTMPAGTLYRGKVGMWSWVLHRITGVAIFFFLLVHVLDTALVRVSPAAYNVVIAFRYIKIKSCIPIYSITKTRMMNSK